MVRARSGRCEPASVGDLPVSALTLTGACADTSAGMSDTFAFRSAPVPLRTRIRRLDRRAVKAGLLAVVLLAAFGRFTDWVVQSERTSFARASDHGASTQIGVIPGGLVTVPAASVTAAFTPEDLRAQRVLLRTTSVVRPLVRGRDALNSAGPAQLGRKLRSLTFTDGPSPVPSIVSVATTPGAWAAAVRSATGTCFEIRLDRAGHARYGAGSGICTGAAALDARDPAWRSAP
jgi:hypothetical protein